MDDEPIVWRSGTTLEAFCTPAKGMTVDVRFALSQLDGWQAELEESLPDGLRFMTSDDMLKGRLRRTMTVVSVN